ncbi:hypothetical protein AAVH_11144 [Aphelenchoides avenae]|nr:hypothetical protein AAVH_11144 [Aphelenchus avenae]
MANKCPAFERYRIYDVLMAVSWLMGIVAFGFFVSPACRMAFIGYTWDTRLCAARHLVPLLEFVFLDPIMLGTLVAYLMILWIIVAQKRSSSITTISATFERCILMFSVLTFSGGITITAIYNVYQGIFPGESLVAAGVTTIMILMSSVNPMFLLVANSDLRRRALTVLGLTKLSGNIFIPQQFKPRVSIKPTETMPTK